MSYPPKQRSNLWYLLPIFLGLIGGIIAFFVLRRDDHSKAKNCLYLGIGLAIIGIIFNIIFINQLGEFEQDLGFRVNSLGFIQVSAR